MNDRALGTIKFIQLDTSLGKDVRNDLDTLYKTKPTGLTVDNYFKLLMIWNRFDRELPKKYMDSITTYFKRPAAQPLCMIMQPRVPGFVLTGGPEPLNMFIVDLVPEDTEKVSIVPRLYARFNWQFPKDAYSTRVVKMRGSDFMLYSIIGDQTRITPASIPTIHFSLYQLKNKERTPQIDVYDFRDDELHPALNVGKYSFIKDYPGRVFVTAWLKYYEATNLLMVCVMKHFQSDNVMLSAMKVKPEKIGNKLTLSTKIVATVNLGMNVSAFEKDGKHCVEMIDSENLFIAFVNDYERIEQNVTCVAYNILTGNFSSFYYKFQDSLIDRIEKIYGYVFQGFLVVVLFGLAKTKFVLVHMGHGNHFGFDYLEWFYESSPKSKPVFFDVNDDIFGISYSHKMHFFQRDAVKGIVYGSEKEGDIMVGGDGTPVFV